MKQMILETKCISKSFHNQPVVRNISLAVPECCVYGLLGPNGAGKSTLLKMLTGILRPTGGEIFFNGHPWSRKDLADIGALVETPPIYENLTAWENLKARALMFDIPDSRIWDVLELTGLTDTGKKRSGQFSLGMKQRLGIAIALLNHPKLLVLDEPVNGLDPIGIRDLRGLIRTFPQEGITVIVSSHILNEIEQTADFIGIMADGMLGFQGEMPDSGHLEELFMRIAGHRREEEAC
ncbi:MAG: lantibiotic protection ABC transporter ATP-binding protein [Lachnospiraceae bacterium]